MYNGVKILHGFLRWLVVDMNILPDQDMRVTAIPSSPPVIIIIISIIHKGVVRFPPLV